jgi:hypothetical protein
MSERIYPYNSAQILTDDLFVSYGGSTGSSTAFQRQAAYEIAEKAMAQNLSALAPITTVTGTYAYPFSGSRRAPGRELWTWWKYVQYVNKVTFIDTREDRYYAVEGTDNVHVGLADRDYGIIDLFTIAQNCACVPYFSIQNPSTLYPYQVEVVYQSGLPTGTYTSASYLLALTKLAEIVINDFGGCGNESSPFVGITEFRNQQYSEKRMGMYMTTLGATPEALYAYNLVKDLQRLRTVGL